MNNWIGIGRLTRDPEIRNSSSGSEQFKSARYTLAVNRKPDKDGNVSADFVQCSCTGKTAEFVEKYLRKGTKICVSGPIRTGSYTNKDGQTVYTTEVRVQSHEFCEKAADNNPNNNAVDTQAAADGFMPLPDDPDLEGLPFA